MNRIAAVAAPSRNLRRVNVEQKLDGTLGGRRRRMHVWTNDMKGAT